MKKTVFEGKVNGQVFDNVNDYNACLQAMLDMGKDVEASSSTKIVECDCECGCDSKCECECEKCQKVDNKPLKANVNFLPGFESDNKSAYIDDLVVLEGSEYDSKLEAIDESMEKIYCDIKTALNDPTNDIHKKEVYLRKVRDIINVIDEDYNKNKEALAKTNTKINSVETELNELKEIQDTLYKAELVIEMYGKWYNEVQNMVEDNLTQLKNSESNVNIEKAEAVKQPASTNVGGFENLLKAVFGK